MAWLYGPIPFVFEALGDEVPCEGSRNDMTRATMLFAWRPVTFFSRRTLRSGCDCLRMRWFRLEFNVMRNLRMWKNRAVPRSLHFLQAAIGSVGGFMWSSHPHIAK